uniref:Uncharacterized protein n=1 Tax=Globodera pallida TaxID=36090 RepID=A0A183C402_GLOPA
MYALAAPSTQTRQSARSPAVPIGAYTKCLGLEAKHTFKIFKTFAAKGNGLDEAINLQMIANAQLIYSELPSCVFGVARMFEGRRHGRDEEDS